MAFVKRVFNTSEQTVRFSLDNYPPDVKDRSQRFPASLARCNVAYAKSLAQVTRGDVNETRVEKQVITVGDSAADHYEVHMRRAFATRSISSSLAAAKM